MAIHVLALRRAPGADMFHCQLCKRMGCLHSDVAVTIHLILKTGRIPTGCRTSLMVPLKKPGKRPAFRESRRPILLLRTFVKIMEAVPRTRTIRYVEARLSPPQYVYREERSTEHVLTGLDDYVNRAL